MYTIDYFIKKFEVIPENQWIAGIYEDYNGKKCAMGHLGYVDYHAVDYLSNCRQIFTLQGIISNIAGINDGHHSSYQQDIPKQRILAALHAIKEKEEGELLEKVSEIAREGGNLVVESVIEEEVLA